MSRTTRLMRTVALLSLLAAAAAQAPDTTTNLPDLATATQATALPTTGTTGTSAATGETSAPTGQTTTQGTTTGASTSATSASTGATSATTTASTDATSTAASATTTFGSSSGSTSVQGLLTNAPTIAGAGIPTMVIPYTANAPFMQKSNMPEGTVFIAVGAILAFLGACVLLWRILVAWSINRSVKRAAGIAVRTGPEKTSTWGSGKGGYYKEFEVGSSMSLDALTSAGKPVRSSHFQDEKKNSSAPPAGLFFSPTAQASNRASGVGVAMDHHHMNRGSSYMPAGYYASPSATDPAGGRASVALGVSVAPYARQSMVNPSPPGSPGLPNSRGHQNYNGHAASTSSREALRTVSRDGYGNTRNSSYLQTQPSHTSLMVGTGAGSGINAGASSEYLAGSRAPSAVMDELFENHGHGPRERF